MKTRTIILSMVFVLLPGVLLWAHGQKKDRMRFAAFRQDHHVMSILDKEQTEKWLNLKLKFDQKANTLNADLRNARLELRHLMASARVPNQGRVDKLISAIEETTNQLHRQRVERQIALRKILSDEQWDKLSEMRKTPPRERIMERRMKRREERIPQNR